MALNTNNATLEISKFKNIEKATDEYNKREMQKSIETDVVLVSAQSFEALMHAYPNYFANVKEFMNTLTGLIKKYRGIK